MEFKNWLENESGLIRMWHGSKRWDGKPEIRAPRKGRYEAGVGIYLTSSYERAREYSKGGGSTMLITLKPNAKYAYDVFIKVETINDFLATLPQSSKIKSIKKDVLSNADRVKSDSIRAEVLINLFINYEAGSGNAGIALANFLRSQGVDANLHHQSMNEMWIVVINPDIIVHYEKVDAKNVKTDMWNLTNQYY